MLYATKHAIVTNHAIAKIAWVLKRLGNQCNFDRFHGLLNIMMVY